MPVGPLLRNHALGRGLAEFALRGSEVRGGGFRVTRIQACEKLLYGRAHATSNALVPKSTFFGLAVSFLGGLVRRHRGFSGWLSTGGGIIVAGAPAVYAARGDRKTPHETPVEPVSIR